MESVLQHPKIDPFTEKEIVSLDEGEELEGSSVGEREEIHERSHEP